jgi:hypothetical protein
MLPMTSNFLTKFSKALIEQKIHACYSPKDLIIRWSKFVDFCVVNGYDDFLVEFDNDIFIRRQVENMLNEEELHEYDEFAIFKKAIFDIDAKFKEILLPKVERSDGVYWWERGILKNGTGDYAQDMQLQYGIKITNAKSG